MTERKRIKVDYLARVEGEGALDIVIDQGRVQDVKLEIFEPPRFFEAFLQGRSFREAPDVTARICGICPVAYQMSAVHAMEDACGVAVDGPLRLRGADRKGYGGLCFRGAGSLKGATMTTDRGPLEKDSTNVAYRWHAEVRLTADEFEGVELPANI